MLPCLHSLLFLGIKTTITGFNFVICMLQSPPTNLHLVTINIFWGIQLWNSSLCFSPPPESSHKAWGKFHNIYMGNAISVFPVLISRTEDSWDQTHVLVQISRLTRFRRLVASIAAFIILKGFEDGVQCCEVMGFSTFTIVRRIK
jgi:hypothetical protein